MSLNVVISDSIISDANAVINIDYEFVCLDKEYSLYADKAVKAIDNGILDKDFAGFIDRFKNHLPISFLSTGCKAAILVPLLSRQVNTIECGYNALEFILCNARKGSIVMQYPNFTLPQNRSIDVIINGNRFLNSSDLDYYFKYTLE